MTAEPLAANAAIHPLFARLFSQHGYAQPEAAGVDAFVGPPGHALLFFSEDPVQYRETLDLCVILPEIAAAFPGRFRVGVLLPGAARAVAPKFGVRRWPTLVFLRAGTEVDRLIRPTERALIEEALDRIDPRPAGE